MASLFERIISGVGAATVPEGAELSGRISPRGAEGFPFAADSALAEPSSEPMNKRYVPPPTGNTVAGLYGPKPIVPMQISPNGLKNINQSNVPAPAPVDLVSQARAKAIEELGGGRGRAALMRFSAAPLNSPEERQLRTTQARIYGQLQSEQAKEDVAKKEQVAFERARELAGLGPQQRERTAQDKLTFEREKLAKQGEWKAMDSTDKFKLQAAQLGFDATKLDKETTARIQIANDNLNAESANVVAKIEAEASQKQLDRESKKALAEQEIAGELERALATKDADSVADLVKLREQYRLGAWWAKAQTAGGANIPMPEGGEKQFVKGTIKQSDGTVLELDPVDEYDRTVAWMDSQKNARPSALLRAKKRLKDLEKEISGDNA